MYCCSVALSRTYRRSGSSLEPPPPLLCDPGWVVKLAAVEDGGPVGQTTKDANGSGRGKKSTYKTDSGLSFFSANRSAPPASCWLL